MIRRAKVEHFRSLKSVDFRLEPLTVFLGPNGSGKSSILHALDPNRQFDTVDYWRHHEQPKVTLWFDDSRRERGVHPANWFDVQTLRLDLNLMRSQNKLATTTALASDGSNLTNLFDSLSRKERDVLSKQYCKIQALRCFVSKTHGTLQPGTAHRKCRTGAC